MFHDDQLRHRFDSPDLNAMEIQPLNNDELPKTAKRDFKRLLKYFFLISLAIFLTILWYFWLSGKSTVADLPLLEFSDIRPDLLDRNFATQWSTNVPSYILGLSRGGRGGVIGLGVSDAFGVTGTFTASECAKIEWTDHDGFSFGSEEFVARHGPNFSVDWIRGDQQEDLFVRVRENLSQNISSLIFLTLEGLEVKPFDVAVNVHQIDLFDPFDFSEWTLSFSDKLIPAGIVSVERFETENPPNVWVSPSTLLPYLRSSQGDFVPKQFAQVPQRIHSIKFLFFKLDKEFVYRITPKSNDLSAVRFPEKKFENSIAAWRAKYVEEFSRKSISQLFGNLGRFSGPLAISNPVQTVTIDSSFVSLTAIGPSRTTFPRGFLWDEGFQLLAIVRANRDIASEILISWLRTQSVSIERGWIPREHALSFRDRASIPPEFLVQDPRIANPPTLIFALTELVKSNELSDESVAKISGHVVRWLDHLEQTQKSIFGDGGKCFRWSLRTSEHCLSSGLDDYPRGSKVNEDECHLDLHAWIMLMVRFLKRVCDGRKIDDLCSTTDWGKKLQEMHANLLEIFSVQKSGILADWIGNQQVGPVGQYPGGSSTTTSKPIHSPHIGYINLMPFFLGLLSPKSDIAVIRGTIDLIENHLVSPFGLLSLSRTDPLFGTGENYWKGNIWANMNLLAVGALASYANRVSDSSLGIRMSELSLSLKSGWLEYAKSAWKFSGGPREYLKPGDGSGGGVYPFAGWTAASIFLLEQNIQFWDAVVGIDD